MNTSRIAKVAAAAALVVAAPLVLAQNIAIVNGKPVPKARLDAMLTQLAKQGQAQSPELESKVKEQLVLREILLNSDTTVAGSTLNTDALRAIEPGAGGEYQVTDAIAKLIEDGHPVHVVVHDGTRHDLGNPGGYIKACVDFALQSDAYGAELRTWLGSRLDS